MKLLVSTLIVHLAPAALAVDFLIEDPLPDGVQRVEEGGARFVSLSKAKTSFGEITVKPATKYTLTLEAGFEGEAESIEENPRFEVFNRLGKTSPLLPAREIRFFDAAGKPVGGPVVHALPFRRSRVYRDVFYTPRAAAKARVTITSGRGLRLRLARMTLDETADEGALNVNPTFESGYSGWKNIAAGGRLIDRDGKTILDTKYGSTGRMIPLPGPGTYGFSAKATGNGYNSVVIVRCYDAGGKELLRTSTRKYGPVTYFVPPKDAVSASFLVYSCLLEELRLVRAGEESAISELRGN